jgi:hypothetical protein
MAGEKYREVAIGYFSKISSDHDSKMAATELGCLALVLALTELATTSDLMYVDDQSQLRLMLQHLSGCIQPLVKQTTNSCDGLFACKSSTRISQTNIARVYAMAMLMALAGTLNELMYNTDQAALPMKAGMKALWLETHHLLESSLLTPQRYVPVSHKFPLN